MENEAFNLNRQFNEVHRLLTEHDKLLDDIRKRELVVFIGPTGAGKSTIISHMLGVPLERVKKDGSRVFQESNPNEQKVHPTIGHSQIKSCTELPNAYYLPELELYLCDTAGLEPARPQLKIFTDVFLQQTQKIRAIVVVLTMGCLQDNRGAQFKEVIREMCKTFELQQIRNRLIFVYNKSDDDLDSKDLYEQLCKMEEHAHEQLGKSLDFNQEHMRMFELIMAKAGFDECNDLARFEKFNLLCSKEEMREVNSNFRQAMLEKLRDRCTEEGTITINMSQQRINLGMYITRSLVRKQLDIRDYERNLVLYQQAVIVERCLKSNIKEDSEQKRKIQTAMNTALLTSEKELEASIRAQQDMLKMIEAQQTKEVPDIIVTNGYQDQAGNYPFKFRLEPTQRPLFLQVSGEYILQPTKDPCLYAGVFHPLSSNFEGRIEILDCAKARSQIFLKQIKIKLEEALSLRRRLMEGGFSDLQELLDDKSRTDIRNRRINDYIDSVLGSQERMFLRLPKLDDLDRYYREYYVVNFINPVKGTLIDPKKMDAYKLTYYYYTEDAQEIPLRCCLHRHLIDKVCELECGHFLQEACWKPEKEDTIRCCICNEERRRLSQPTSHVKVQLIRAMFGKFFGV